MEYDRATNSRVDKRLTALIASDDRIGVTEPVVMEVLAGARSDVRRLLLRCKLLRFDAAVDFDAGVRIYRACRRAGITPRGMVDCMIASVAQRHQAALLAQDADLARVAGVMGITLDTA